MKKLFRALLPGVLALSVNAMAADPGPLTHLWTTEGFAEPESVVVDAARDRLIVSNIDGHPGEVDGEGFLSLLDPDGSVVNRQWVGGLDAPKGMAIHEGRLYVSDITALHEIDLERGRLVRSFEPDDARFLNDVTVTADGDVYVTDMMANAVYRLHDGRLTRWSEDDGLHHPNGILAQDGRLIVGNWGTGLESDFTTATPGSLVLMDADGAGIEPVPNGDALGNIDGVAALGHYLVVSDWVKGTLTFLPQAGGAVETHAVEPGVADIGAAGDRLYVPLMRTGRVSAYSVSASP